MKNNVICALDNIYNKTGIIVDYDIDFFNHEKIYGSCNIDKIIRINNKVDNVKEFEKIIFHEYVHLKLEIDSKLMYDVLSRKYYDLYCKYLDEFVKSYSFLRFGIRLFCSIDLNKVNLTDLVDRLKNDNKLSNIVAQFSYLNEFIVHNLDYWYMNDFKNNLYDDILEMNQFVYKTLINI